MEVRVRNVDEWVVASLRARARSNKNTLEGEIRELLQKEAMRPRLEAAAEIRRLRDQMRRKYGMFSDSAALIREDRDARG